MSHPHPLTWLYRKLGPRYPSVFITVELQTAFLVATGAVALFSFYYSVSSGDFLTILAITLGLTAIGIGFVLVRVLRRLRPLNAWIGGERSAEQTAEAWHLAVDMPIQMVRRDFWVPFVVTRDHRRRGDRDPRAQLARLLPDRDRGAARHRVRRHAALPGARAGDAADSLRHQLGARPTGADRPPGGAAAGEAARLAAADQRDHRPRRRGAHLEWRRHRRAHGRRADRAVRLLHDQLRAHGAADALDPAPDRGPRGGDRADPPGPLRRARAGDDLGRVRRALLGLQPDGRRAGRAGAPARGVRHLPRRGGRPAPDLRGLRARGRGARGLAGLRRRPGLHRRGGRGGRARGGARA